MSSMGAGASLYGFAGKMPGSKRSLQGMEEKDLIARSNSATCPFLSGSPARSVTKRHARLPLVKRRAVCQPNYRVQSIAPLNEFIQRHDAIFAWPVAILRGYSLRAFPARAAIMEYGRDGMHEFGTGSLDF